MYFEHKSNIILCNIKLIFLVCEEKSISKRTVCCILYLARALCCGVNLSNVLQPIMSFNKCLLHFLFHNFFLQHLSFFSYAFVRITSELLCPHQFQNAFTLVLIDEEILDKVRCCTSLLTVSVHAQEQSCDLFFLHPSLLIFCHMLVGILSMLISFQKMLPFVSL